MSLLRNAQSLFSAEVSWMLTADFEMSNEQEHPNLAAILLTFLLARRPDPPAPINSHA